MASYSVEFYTSASGRTPVEDFLSNLARKKPKAWSKCMIYIKHLANYGPSLMSMHQYAEKVEADIWALRPEWQNEEYRLFYTWDKQKGVFVLVDALVKHTQQLREVDKKRVRARVKEVLNG